MLASKEKSTQILQAHFSALGTSSLRADRLGIKNTLFRNGEFSANDLFHENKTDNLPTLDYIRGRLLGTS